MKPAEAPSFLISRRTIKLSTPKLSKKQARIARAKRPAHGQPSPVKGDTGALAQMGGRDRAAILDRRNASAQALQAAWDDYRRGNVPKPPQALLHRPTGPGEVALARANSDRLRQTIRIEPRDRTSTGQVIEIGGRNIDGAAPIDRYFNRRELDADEYRNDRLFRAAQRIHEAFVVSNLVRPGASRLVAGDRAGVPDKWETLKLDALRAYNRAVRALSGSEREIISFVVVYEAGHAKDWARLKGIPERGAIDFLRRGLTDLAIYYGLLKKPALVPNPA